MNDWKTDKNWSDRFIPEIKSIIGSHLICEPPIEEDQQRNTDLMVLKMDSVRIGCRIRKHKYLATYGNEFTIRMSRPSGAKTELAKIIEGWGDYLFYGFADTEEASLALWRLIDLKAFRLWFMRMLYDKDTPTSKLNHDNSSGFMPFDLTEAPSELIFAEGGHNA